MKVKQQILDQIIEPDVRRQLAGILEVLDSNIYKAIKDNTDDGLMTKWKFLKAVSVVLKIEITEILEDSVPEVPQK